MRPMKGRVLICAGSDSGGGAGIQADIKTVTCLGGFAMTAITALTAQNTKGVFGVHDVPEAFITKQIELVMNDLGADCIKTGMLHSIPVIETVHTVLENLAPDTPLVVDPVMVAKGGHPLLEPQALDAMKRRIVARATILTPNIPEAELFRVTATKITDRNDSAPGRSGSTQSTPTAQAARRPRRSCAGIAQGFPSQTLLAGRGAYVRKAILPVWKHVLI